MTAWIEQRPITGQLSVIGQARHSKVTLTWFSDWRSPSL